LFGSAVELADVNGDGYADAIIGSTGESLGVQVNAGMFHVVPGSPSGLDLESGLAYSQGGNLPGTSELGDFFGYNITSGDFDNDGYDDVVVSAPFEGIESSVQAGSFMVIPGGSEGLDTERAELFSQDGDVAGTADDGDFLGWSLATGDFNGDGFDDLGAGVPGEDSKGREDSGAVNVFYGSGSGLSADGNQLFSQAGSVLNRPEVEDFFGFSVAASDLNCDGYDELLVGVPNEQLGGVVAGLVNILMGSEAGLTKSGNNILVQGSRGVAGNRDFNQFGAALAAGDFDGDGCGDIAVSAHTTDVGGSGSALCIDDPLCVRQAGAVVLVYGSEDWPKIGGTAHFTQRGPIGGSAREDNFFGRTLAALDINGDGRDDLAVGIPSEDVGNKIDVGRVAILRGTPNGLTSKRSYLISQAGTVAGKPESLDRFGSALADVIS
jgi:hypothetical protein